MFILLAVLAAFAELRVTSMSVRSGEGLLDDEASDIPSLKYNDVQNVHYINESGSEITPRLLKEWTKTSKDTVYLAPGETVTFSFTFGANWAAADVKYELSDKSPQNSILFSCNLRNPNQESSICGYGYMMIYYERKFLSLCKAIGYSSLENVNAGKHLNFQAFTRRSSSVTHVDCKIYAMSCGKRNVNRIVGGKETLPHEFPWMVSFGFRFKPYISLCGGSIIDQYHILTAAHCFPTKSQTAKLIAIVGLHDINNISLSAKAKPLLVKKVFLHENFDYDTLTNDIAIIKVAEPIPFDMDNSIAPVCLPSMPRNAYSNVEATVCGFGLTEGDDLSRSSPVLLHYIAKTISTEECQKSYETKITDGMVCTLSSEKYQSSICSGDSGGPLMYQNGNQMEQIGIVSFSIENCPPNTPNGFARVTSYLEWINRHIN